MKSLITNYTFNKTAKTITFTDSNFTPAIERILIISNITQNKIIFSPQTSLGGTLAGTVLTLAYDTTTHNDADKLQIIYEFETVETPSENLPAIPISPRPQKLWRNSFSKVVAAGVDTTNLTLKKTGSGMAVSQAGGNLVITTGTTANEETIIRSNIAWDASFILKYGTTLSQRIVNNNFFVEMVDVIGDSLAFVVNSTTSVTVTIPSNTFTSANVGQSMYIGNFAGLAGVVPMRAPIASVSGNDVTFTVAGFPGSGSGTCSLFGWNYHHVLYDSTTATSTKFDTQRSGWAAGDTTATINTSASGHIGYVYNNDNIATYQDSTLTPTTSVQPLSFRASKYLNIPDNSIQLYLQVRALNGTTNPATTTTWTVQFLSIEDFSPLPVMVQGGKSSAGQPTYVAVQSMPSTSGVAGAAAHDASISGNPVRIGARALTANYAAVSSGDTTDLITTLVGALIQKPYAIPELDFTFSAPKSGIAATATALTIKDSAGAGLRNYITALTIATETLGAATELEIRESDLTCSSQTISSNTITTSAVHGLAIGDQVVFTATTMTGGSAIGITYYVLTVPSTTTLTLSATRGGSTLTITGTGVTATLHRVLFNTKLNTTLLPLTHIKFPTPLKGAVATALQAQTVTSSSSGAVFVNGQGYIAP